MTEHPIIPGTLEKIGGIDCYVGTPKGDYAKEKVVLFLSDAFGLDLVNNKVILSVNVPSLRILLTSRSADPR